MKIRSFIGRREFESGLLVVALAFLYAYYRTGGLLTFGFGNQPPLGKDDLDHYWDFSIQAPFLYRCVIPALGWVLKHVTPLCGFHTTLIIEFAGALAAFASFAALLKNRIPRATPVRTGTLALTGLLALTSVFPRYIPYFYPYDTWGLACVNLLLWLYFTGRWTWFWPTLLVSTGIRETSIFVPIFIFFDRPRTKANVTECASFAAAWLAVRLLIAKVIFSGAGPSFQHQWPENVRFFITEGSLSRWLVWFATIGVFVFLTARAARRTPRLKPYLHLTFVFLAGMFYVGNLFEYRIYTELTPFLLLPLLLDADRGTAA